MSYLTREDGERFVIPSYRDVLSSKNKNQLKKDILLLSQNYGEYITLQRKSPTQYEVAFSPDTGYLLGETVWHYFKRPVDMIYCEAIPNTTEAILVIVKAGSVYLDGRFPLDSIPEELIIFLTQKNSFEIFIYGDVPISQTPEEGKFSFEETSVKSFTILDAPVFPQLPLLKTYQLQLVDQVLRKHGIGVFPTRQIVMAFIALALIYMIYSYISSRGPEIKPIIVMTQVNPYQPYNEILTSPAPDQEISRFVAKMRVLYTMPGWSVASVAYAKNEVKAAVKSDGGKIANLEQWAKPNDARITVEEDGIYVLMNLNVPRRPVPKNIYLLRDSLIVFIDSLSTVYPGNHIQMGEFVDKGPFNDVTFVVNVDNITLPILDLIGQQFKGLPFVLQKMEFSVQNGSLSGSINMEALGS